MNRWRSVAKVGVLAALMLVALGSNPGFTQSRAHVYLLRGLMNIFSLGMDELAQQLQRRGVNATVDGYSDWQTLADQAAARYRAGTEGPIILIGHSLGADAVMQMADYLDKKGIPVALVVPFDGTQSFQTPANVARLLNLTQRDYAYMTRGPGFHGSLLNVDVSSDPSIDHLNIDKSPRLHARVIGEILSIIGGGRRTAMPKGAKPAVEGRHGRSSSDGAALSAPVHAPAAKAEASAEPQSDTANGAAGGTGTKPLAENGTPQIALPEPSGANTYQPHQ